jgi:hypothetical protein
MENKDLQLLVLSTERLKSLIAPVLNKLDLIEKNLDKKTTSQSIKYYRNKELKEKFGLSANTIIKYRDLGVIPYTVIGEVYLYPIKHLEDVLKENSNLELFNNLAS